jgi:hypothetical protein
MYCLIKRLHQQNGSLRSRDRVDAISGKSVALDVKSRTTYQTNQACV